MTVAEWKALSLGPVAGKRERKDVQKRLSTWNTSVLFTLTLNLMGWRAKEGLLNISQKCFSWTVMKLFFFKEG